MILQRAASLLGLIGLVGLMTVIDGAQEAKSPPQPQGIEPLARGPVHEAYAEPMDARPQPSPVVPKQPPKAIDELPPDQKPAGDNVVWIPGYWAWDDESKDFLWVSGFWRVPPPGRQRMPGNWQEVDGGWQWVPGFWTGVGQEEIQYVSHPPPSIDSGPSVPAPEPNSSYVPGCWIFREAQLYWWRPGFWLGFKPGWVWSPARYLWTTGGCVFVDGFWDYPLEERGLLFAPVRIEPGVLATPGWSYVPQYVVQPDFLMGALFVRPTCQHYYFGDYFAQSYQRQGFVPWVDYRTSRFSHDPIFAYYRQRFAEDRNWEPSLRNLYQDRRDGGIPRPPHTLTQQNQLVQDLTVNKRADVAVNNKLNLTNRENVRALAALTQINNSRVTNLGFLGRPKTVVGKKVQTEGKVLKLAPVPPNERVHEQKAAQQIRAVAQQRHQAEAKLLHQGTHPLKPTDGHRTVKVPLPRPPALVAPPAKPGVRVGTPPPPPAVPKHVERPIPHHEPPKPPAPPKKVVPPKVQPKVTPPAPKPPVPPQKGSTAESGSQLDRVL